MVLSECEQDLGRDGLESDSQEALIRRLASEVLSGKAVSTAWGEGSLMAAEVKLRARGSARTTRVTLYD